MRTNRVVLAAMASVLAFTLVGCGSDDDGAKVPSAGGDGSVSAGATGGGSGGDGDELATYIKGQQGWVKCMRDNDVDLPDPDGTGKVELGRQARTLKQDPKFMKASDKCADKMPAVPESVEEANRPKLTPEQIKTQREYAECMQKNGAPDFPDPGPDGNTRNNNSGTPEWDQASAGALRAGRTCGPIIGQPANPSAGLG